MTLQISSLTSETVGMVLVGILAILGGGYALYSLFSTYGLMVYVGWLVALVLSWALLGGQAEQNVDHSERPAEVLEQARDNNGEQ